MSALRLTRRSAIHHDALPAAPAAAVVAPAYHTHTFTHTLTETHTHPENREHQQPAKTTQIVARRERECSWLCDAVVPSSQPSLDPALTLLESHGKQVVAATRATGPRVPAHRSRDSSVPRVCSAAQIPCPSLPPPAGRPEECATSPFSSAFSPRPAHTLSYPRPKMSIAFSQNSHVCTTRSGLRLFSSAHGSLRSSLREFGSTR